MGCQVPTNSFVAATSPQALWLFRAPQERALWATSPPQAVLRPARLNALSADTGIPVSELIQMGTGGATRDDRAAIRGETGVSGATLAARSQHYASDPVAVTPVAGLVHTADRRAFFTASPSQRPRLERECNLRTQLQGPCPNLALRMKLEVSKSGKSQGASCFLLSYSQTIGMHPRSTVGPQPCLACANAGRP
jgi:hypothetical protein